MENKYSNFVSKLLTGETLRISLESPKHKEAIRSAISREKTRQEDALRSFELPVENTRINWKKVNGSDLHWEVCIKPLSIGFEIFSEVPPLSEDDSQSEKD